MKLLIENIEIGMSVGQDLYTESGQLITPSNTVVTPLIMHRLKRFKIKDVEIVEDDEYKKYRQKRLGTYTDITSNLFDVRETEGFKNFKTQCTEVKKNLTISFDSLLKNKDTNNDEQIGVLKRLGLALYESNKLNLNLMDMIYNLHQHSDLMYTHSINVGMIAGHLGGWLGFPEDEVQLLITCGLFHDIGKLLIPKHILEKPGALTEDEYRIIQTHSIEGYELLKQFDNLDDRIKNVALLHHERCDGSGYPLRIGGDRLDKYSKIVAIADTYEAMTADRIYRGPICPFTVTDYFERDGLHKFETQFMLKFIDKMMVSYIHSAVLLSNNMKAKVVLINKNIKSRPLVVLEDGTFIDLSKTSDISIVSMIN